MYELPLYVSMLANFHMCGIMLVLTAVFNLLVRAYVF